MHEVIQTDPTLQRSAPADLAHARAALQLAERGLGLTAPNPMVGAVVLAADGSVAGQGWHEGPGTDHAEVMALREAGARARGGTLFVTLEPCSHVGRTPPCAPAVVRAGIRRVVACLRDPNPVVDGRGFEVLREAGIEVEEGIFEEEALRLNVGFATHVRTGRPFVTLKLAASLDGRTAARDGTSRWITGEAARRDVHRLRARSGAVVVGAGTALADDPALTVRLDGYRGRQPLRVLVDGRGRVPPAGALFDGSAPLMVATTDAAAPAARAGWSAAGAAVLIRGGADGRVSMAGLMQGLGDRGIQEVLIEGGPSLAWSALEERAVDRLVLYLAPTLIGGSGAPGVLGGDGVPTLADALPAAIGRVERLGEDLRVEADVHRDR